MKFSLVRLKQASWSRPIPRLKNFPGVELNHPATWEDAAFVFLFSILRRNHYQDHVSSRLCWKTAVYRLAGGWGPSRPGFQSSESRNRRWPFTVLPSTPCRREVPDRRQCNQGILIHPILYVPQRRGRRVEIFIQRKPGGMIRPHTSGYDHRYIELLAVRTTQGS